MRRLVATVFGLCSLAVAGPLFAVMGTAATFFSAHSAGRTTVLLFTLVWLVVPTLFVLAGVLIVRAVRPELASGASALCVGGLIALTLVPLTKQAIELRIRWYLAVAVIVTVPLALAYARNERFRSLLPWTALAAPAVAASFLFISPVSAFVLPAKSTLTGKAVEKPNVVVVTFDEFPLAALLDENGEINAKRFPAFGDLARRSTWYRNVTTVAPWTQQAVPAILSGSVPRIHVAPISSVYPRNVFSVLRPTHHLRASEIATYMCTAAECGTPPKDALGPYKDSAVIYLHVVLPRSLRTRWLPALGARWANFDKPDGAHLQAAVSRQRVEDAADEGARFARFNKGLTPAQDGRPTVWFGHFLLPHLPLLYLPDGRTYRAGSDAYGLTQDEFEWTGNSPLMDVSRQRFLLQLKYADKLIGQTVKALERRGLYDDTMLVVTADHGFVFQRGSRRGSPLTKARAPEILPVPLFIKYPGQAKGSVNRRPVQTIDIMPTIADVLRVRASTERLFDGSSLLGKEELRQRTYVETGEPLHPPLKIDLRPAIRPYLDLFGTWESNDDVFAWGPHRALLGTKLEPTRPPRGQSATLLSGRIDRYNSSSPSVPAFVQLAFDRDHDAKWFAVTVNGVVAGLGRTYSDGRQTRGVAMLNPRYLDRRKNEVGVALLGGNGDIRFVRVS